MIFPSIALPMYLQSYSRIIISLVWLWWQTNPNTNPKQPHDA